MNSSSSDEDITTKEKERVRKKKYRARLSKKDTEDNRLLDKERKAKARSQMTDAQLEERRRKDRERKAAKKAQLARNAIPEVNNADEPVQKPKYVTEERENNRKYRERTRAERTEDEVEFDNIVNLLHMRRAPDNRDGKKHLLDNLKAKRAMREAKETGKEPVNREQWIRSKHEINLWYDFWHRNSESKNIMRTRKPELAERFTKEAEEIWEMSKCKAEEDEKLWAEKRKEGFWHYQGDIDDYVWIGEGPAPDTEEFRLEAPTEEDDIAYLKQLDEWNKAEIEERRMKDILRQREWRKKNADKMKAYRAKKKVALQEELDKPIEMPELEKSKYELIREEIIRERHEAMKAAGIFN